jgi:NTP pyrophosphatase (non-canonical NTP hydrolase)
MELNDYQNAATKTAVYPGKQMPMGLMYVALKMNGEAGEFAEHVGKSIRDEAFGVGKSDLSNERHALLVKEVGDVLWYLAAACNELGVDLNDVAKINLEKLRSRQERGTLSGSGDER